MAVAFELSNVVCLVFSTSVLALGVAETEDASLSLLVCATV